MYAAGSSSGLVKSTCEIIVCEINVKTKASSITMCNFILRRDPQYSYNVLNYSSIRLQMNNVLAT